MKPLLLLHLALWLAAGTLNTTPHASRSRSRPDRSSSPTYRLECYVVDTDSFAFYLEVRSPPLASYRRFAHQQQQWRHLLLLA